MKKITITTTHKVTYCGNCPHYKNTMDGMCCGLLEKQKGAYAGMIIDQEYMYVKKTFPPKCPLI